MTSTQELDFFDAHALAYDKAKSLPNEFASLVPFLQSCDVSIELNARFVFKIPAELLIDFDKEKASSYFDFVSIKEEIEIGEYYIKAFYIITCAR